MRIRVSRLVVTLLAGAYLRSSALAMLAQSPQVGEELFLSSNQVGHYGGHLVVSLRSEPMTGDLIHINRLTQDTEPALAKTWQVSPDGLKYTLQLRHGLRISDGHPVNADDVLFSFKIYLDENAHSPQRDSLIIADKPISVKRTDAYTVFELARPYAAAERLFDSVAILPKHLLEKPYQEGKLAQAWGLGSSPGEIAGLGPFWLKEYLPGQRVTLERNPYYWQTDRKWNRLPYLDEITFLFVTSADAEVIRFQAGDTDIINRLGAPDASVLEANQSVHVYDLGPSLEYNFLFFNLNTKIPAQSNETARKQNWFRQVKFRQAISLAVDRNGITRLVYQGRATALWTPVTPARKFWIDAAIPHPPRSVDQARKLPQSAGFKWKPDGTMVDGAGSPVEFSILTSASNSQRTQMATMIQADLKQLGIRVHVVPLEFPAVLDRIFQTHDYEAAVLALGGGDVDPNSQMNVWLSSGSDHLWNIEQPQPSTPWEAEIDQLMEKQLSTLKPDARKHLYDRVQEIFAENVPLICLVSPNILVGAKKQVADFEPATLDPHTLWNAQQQFLSGNGSSERP